VDLDELSPVGGRAAGGSDWRRVERFAEVREGLTSRGRIHPGLLPLANLRFEVSQLLQAVTSADGPRRGRASRCAGLLGTARAAPPRTLSGQDPGQSDTNKRGAAGLGNGLDLGTRSTRPGRRHPLWQGEKGVAVQAARGRRGPGWPRRHAPDSLACQRALRTAGGEPLRPADSVRPFTSAVHLPVRPWSPWSQCFPREAAERPVPGYVDDELRGYLECGLLCFGFARAVCTTCRTGFVVAARLSRARQDGAMDGPPCLRPAARAAASARPATAATWPRPPPTSPITSSRRCR